MRRKQLRNTPKMEETYRSFWTNKFKTQGKDCTWREPYETMYNFVESQRIKAKSLHASKRLPDLEYQCITSSCDRLQLELYLFLGEERQISLHEISA